MENDTSERRKWRRVVLLSILEKLYFCAKLTWGILTLGLGLFCLAKFLNPPTFTSLSMEPAEVFEFPVITLCQDPFWRVSNQTSDQFSLELPYGTEETMEILWKLKNSTSHSVLSPLRTVTFGQLVGTKDKDWKMDRNMFLETDPGLNFLNKGKWSSNFFRDFNDNIHLCFTLIDKEDYKRDDSHFLLFETDDDRTRWQITLTSPMDALSNVFTRGSPYMFQFTIEPAHIYHVIFHVEEYNFLNREQFKCNKDRNYTYSSCVEKCLKEDFVNGQMSRDNPCRIIGFEEAKQLKPCQSRKEHDEVSEREFLVGGFIYGLDKKKNEDTWSEAKNPVLFKRIIAGGRFLRSYMTAKSFRSKIQMCEIQCPSPCRQFLYSFQKTPGKPRKSDNYTFIWFGNHQATRPVTTQDWNYTGLEMAADIGGYVGVLLGISFLSISHGILERLRRSVAKDQEEETKK